VGEDALRNALEVYAPSELADDDGSVREQVSSGDEALHVSTCRVTHRASKARAPRLGDSGDFKSPAFVGQFVTRPQVKASDFRAGRSAHSKFETCRPAESKARGRLSRLKESSPTPGDSRVL